MSHKKKISLFIIIFISLSVTLLAFDLFISKFWLTSFYRQYSEIIFLPLFLISTQFFIFDLILLFCKKAVYDAWKLLAIMYLVLSGLLALRQLSIQDTGGGVILGSGGYIGGLEYILAGIFVVISLLIIIIQSIRLAGKAEAEKEEIEQKEE